MRDARLIRALLFAAALGPLVYLGYGAARGSLGANPIEAITRATGIWTLRFLLLTLAVTPLRMLSGWNGLIRFRRMLGLFAFFYASLHLVTYVWLDQFFDWAAMAKDIAKRPFITAGLSTYVLLVPLALTSTAGMIRRLGGPAWRRLHRLAYVAAATGVVHYWWLVKLDTRPPRNYALALAALLLVRAFVPVRGRGVRPRRGTATSTSPR